MCKPSLVLYIGRFEDYYYVWVIEAMYMLPSTSGAFGLRVVHTVQIYIWAAGWQRDMHRPPKFTCEPPPVGWCVWTPVPT